MAAALNRMMLNTITNIFAARAPTTNIAGVTLTRDEAAQLMHTCSALKNALNLQIDNIGQMPSIPKERIVTKLRQILTRQTDIHIHLTLIVSKTRSSNMPWVREFGDAHVALDRKIMVINIPSRELEWKNVARQCWPIVAVTYGWFLPSVLRLQSELRRALRREDLWATDNTTYPREKGHKEEQQELAALYTNPPRVQFGKEAIVQKYRIRSMIDEQYVGEPTAAVLSDDRKRTAEIFEGKKTMFEV